MNLNEIKGRCVIDGETCCWHWRGAMNCDAKRRQIPVIWHEGRSTSGMRVVFELSGRAIPAGHMVWRTCRCDDCLSPAHLACGTRKAWGAWRAENGHAAIRPEAWAANMLAKRRNGQKVTAEMAEAIKASPETGAEMARQYGLSKTAVSRIRTGRSWADTVPQASVFSWRP